MKLVSSNSRVIMRELNSDNVATLVDAIIQHAPSAQSTDLLTLDLSDVCFAKPSGLVPLITHLEANSVKYQETVQIICPEDINCLTYLAASNFIQIASKYAHIENHRGFLSSSPGNAETLIPLTQLIDSEDAGNIRLRVASALNEMLIDSDTTWNNAKKAISSTIHEIAANVFDHAQTRCGWVTAQRYFNSFQKKYYVELAIGDAGRGIRASLAERHHHIATQTDAEALYQMVLQGLSRRGDHGGTGYSFIQRVTKEYDGSFRLRSGSGALSRLRNKQTLEKTEVTFWPGTQLAARVTCG